MPIEEQDLEPSTLGQCFVMQPFDRGTFDKRYNDIFKKAIEAANLEPYRIDNDPSPDILIDHIEKAISESLVCFAEITKDNPNVWYELGFAIASNKPVCLVCSSERKESFPFDVRHRNIIKYEVSSSSDFENAAQQITKRLKAICEKQSKIDSLSDLKLTTQTQGLTPHEQAILVLILAQFDSVDGVPAYRLRQDMKSAGYTDIATAIAIEKLTSKKYLACKIHRDAEEYITWSLTEKGRNWLIANENRLSLHIEKPSRNIVDDIPF